MFEGDSGSVPDLLSPEFSCDLATFPLSSVFPHHPCFSSVAILVWSKGQTFQLLNSFKNLITENCMLHYPVVPKTTFIPSLFILGSQPLCVLEALVLPSKTGKESAHYNSVHDISHGEFSGISPVVSEKRILQEHSSVAGRQQANISLATKQLCLFFINMTQCDSNGMKLFFMQKGLRNKRSLSRPLVTYDGHSTKNGEQIRGQNYRATSPVNR